ncbi:MAG: GtrA family protein [Bryobacteraceae bacterium]|jgi:putative flippase GtrA
MSKRLGLRRWLKFNTVGAIGIGAQLAALAFFHRALRLGYLAGTALAVECVILHNFAWHERWTWSDCASPGSTVARLLRFNFSVGLVSLVCNVAGMRVLVGAYRMPYLAANLVCVAAGAIANFLAADLFVFRRPMCHHR